MKSAKSIWSKRFNLWIRPFTLGSETVPSKIRPPSFNPFTPDSTKSKIDQISKITNWVKLKNKQHYSKELLNSFTMNGHVLYIESKARKLCITQGFSLGVKGLNMFKRCLLHEG